MKVKLTSLENDAEMKIANAGGISHANEIETLDDARELNKKFISWGHETPLEFSSATFYIEGISRTCLAQLTRHRLASFLVKSQRYVNHSKSNMVIPGTVEKWASQKESNRDMLDNYIDHYHYLYDRMLEDDVPKQDARFFLPEGTKTSLYLKANFREFRHIIKLRGGKYGAQWEIKELAKTLLNILVEKAPSIFEDLLNE